MPNSESLHLDGIQPKWWSFKFLGFNVYCYNFDWRKNAILRHDLHHIATDYPFNLIGEMQVATWEFAAGRYPSIFATLFCLPLVGIGALLWPKRIYSAFIRGRNNTSLYRIDTTCNLLDLTVYDLKMLVEKQSVSTNQSNDLIAYLKLVMQSLALIVGPLLVALWILL